MPRTSRLDGIKALVEAFFLEIEGLEIKELHIIMDRYVERHGCSHQNPGNKQELDIKRIEPLPLSWEEFHNLMLSALKLSGQAGKGHHVNLLNMPFFQ